MFVTLTLCLQSTLRIVAHAELGYAIVERVERDCRTGGVLLLERVRGRGAIQPSQDTDSHDA